MAVTLTVPPAPVPWALLSSCAALTSPDPHGAQWCPLPYVCGHRLDLASDHLENWRDNGHTTGIATASAVTEQPTRIASAALPTDPEGFEAVTVTVPPCPVLEVLLKICPPRSGSRVLRPP